MPDNAIIQVWKDHAIPVGETGENVVVTVLDGGTVYYGDRQVTPASALGSLTVGQSVTLVQPGDWLISASLSEVRLSATSRAFDTSTAAKLGSDLTVGGPGGSPLTSSALSATSSPTTDLAPFPVGAGNQINWGAAPVLNLADPQWAIPMDGVTADTGQTQAAVYAYVAKYGFINGISISMPVAKTILLSDTLKIGNADGSAGFFYIAFVGPRGRAQAALTMVTGVGNRPVVLISSNNTHSLLIEGLRIGFQDQQNVMQHPRSFGIMMGASNGFVTYWSEVNRCRFDRCTSNVGVDPTLGLATSWWGTTFDKNLSTHTGHIGYAMLSASNAGGNPSLAYRDIQHQQGCQPVALTGAVSAGSSTFGVATGAGAAWFAPGQIIGFHADQTALTSGCSAAAGTLTVPDATIFQAGQTLQLDRANDNNSSGVGIGETVTVGSVSGTTITLSGTTARAHLSGAVVYVVGGEERPLVATLTAGATGGTNTITVSTGVAALYVNGQSLFIDKGTPMERVVISSINVGTGVVTLTGNLMSSHASGASCIAALLVAGVSGDTITVAGAVAKPHSASAFVLPHVPTGPFFSLRGEFSIDNADIEGWVDTILSGDSMQNAGFHGGLHIENHHLLTPSTSVMIPGNGPVFVEKFTFSTTSSHPSDHVVWAPFDQLGAPPGSENQGSVVVGTGKLYENAALMTQLHRVACFGSTGQCVILGRLQKLVVGRMLKAYEKTGKLTTVSTVVNPRRGRIGVDCLQENGWSMADTRILTGWSYFARYFYDEDVWINRLRILISSVVTSVTALTNTAGAATLNVGNGGAGWNTGMVLVVNPGGGTQETVTLGTYSSGTALPLAGTLANTHATGETVVQDTAFDIGFYDSTAQILYASSGSQTGKMRTGPAQIDAVPVLSTAGAAQFVSSNGLILLPAKTVLYFAVAFSGGTTGSGGPTMNGQQVGVKVNQLTRFGSTPGLGVPMTGAQQFPLATTPTLNVNSLGSSLPHLAILE